MSTLKKTIKTSCLVVLFFASFHSIGKAYCSLRDPSHQIFTFFPQATGYKSVLHTIDSKLESYLINKVNLSMHSGELGKHTVFFALENNNALGYVHVRTELGKWGLIEVLWAINLEGEIVSFDFQRCRGKQCNIINNSIFKRYLIGKTLPELRTMLSPDNKSIIDPKINLPDESVDLALIVLQSAIKTIVITENVWSEELTLLSQSRAKIPSNVSVAKLMIHAQE